MGGNALKHLSVQRVNTTEFISRLGQFQVFAIDYLKENADDKFQFGFPIPIKGKESYGDLDVIYTIDPNKNEKLIAFFKGRFDTEGYKKNGNVTSVEWKGFQVDFIFTKPEYFDWALNWYSHGDHAAVQGRVYRYYSFKYGWDGLYYSFGTKSFNKDILITRDWKEGNNILGYKPLSYEFEYSEQDVFEHTVSSPFVSSSIFNNMKMDRPRESQVRFYEWVKLQTLNEEKLRNFGLILLRKFSFNMYLSVRFGLIQMHLRELFNPIRRKYRKFRYKYFNRNSRSQRGN